MRVEATVMSSKGQGLGFEVRIHGMPVGLDHTGARTIGEARRLVAQLVALSSQVPAESVMVDFIAGDPAAARAIDGDRIGGDTDFDLAEVRVRHRRGVYRAAR
ncbi:hypothetical protein [Streptomyces sp. cg35]|uniref:hypothetical protein n=1 Tax=Streptomyces sp. cg35 TaxID=3421650 RepID=UPI003D166912